MEPTYKSPNAINWKPKFDAWNAILMAVNAKLSLGADKIPENGQLGKYDDNVFLEKVEERPKTIKVWIIHEDHL